MLLQLPSWTSLHVRLVPLSIRGTFQGMLCGMLSVASLFATSLGHTANEGFAGGITPSRFEIDTKQGDLLRRSFKLYNLGVRPQQFLVRTVDWHFSPEGQISFQDELAEDSCREWVRLERHKISVVPDPQRPRNFRFEVQVPADASPRQCRFALMVESTADAVDTSFADGALSMPVTGRVAVIVYLNIGDVQPDLLFGTLAVREVNAQRIPTMEVHNSGAAHGRLDADLVALQEDGSKIRLSIESTPVMPHQTRFMAIRPEAGKTLKYPLTIKGKLYNDSGAYEVQQELQSADPQFIARD